ncbi:hypothetical protein GCM10008014_45240 [Paenibacillus silvae]|uniref:Uncharacterized protein n=1 Tax=Paenibacillus silvae TaxID=1325358 RepID=A0ABQ1ZGN2_9BACL|nr:hypothetical protein GCM10008014_45240 [Paenibacillus silvae]
MRVLLQIIVRCVFTSRYDSYVSKTNLTNKKRPVYWFVVNRRQDVKSESLFLEYDA